MVSQFVRRRRFPRIPARHPVLVKRLGDDSEGFARARTMGLGGCGFVSREPLGEGSPVELLISVDLEVLRARGWVVYEHYAEGRFEVGVAFTELGPDERKLIEQLVSDRSEPGTVLPVG